MRNALFALIALAVVSPGLAQEPPPAVQAAHHRVVAFLELTEDQVAAWNEIYAIHREAEQPLKEDIAAINQELEALLGAEDPDPAEVGELAIARQGLRAELVEVHMIYNEAFMALLEEEQAQRLAFLRRADDVQWVIPSFKLFELIGRS